MSKCSDPNIRNLVYFEYFHSLLSYGIIFGGNSLRKDKIFILQKRVVSSSFKNILQGSLQKIEHSYSYMPVHSILNAVCEK